MSFYAVGVLFALLELAIIGGVDTFITLGSRELGSVHRLLNKLHLSWV